jgi:hypothetical protein
MSFPKNIKELCTPAAVYLIVSVLSIALLVIQNLGNSSSYAVGAFSCKVPSTILVFTVKLIYVLFWTWVLNLICKDGYVGISWLLILFPWLLLIVIIGLIMINK